MPKYYSHITFRCGHHEISTIKPETKTIWSKIKSWTQTNRRSSSSLCDMCKSNTPRKAPLARETSQPLAALAQVVHDTGIKAVQSAQFYRGVYTRTPSQIEDRFYERQSMASKAKRDLDKISRFWIDTHASHLANFPRGVVKLSKPGPNTCQLCRGVLRSLSEPQYQIDQSGGLLRRYERSKVPPVPKELLDSLLRSKRRRRRRVFSSKMSLIIEEAVDPVPDALHPPVGSGYPSPYLWQPGQGVASEGNSTNDTPNPTSGLWQKPQLSAAASSEVAPISHFNSTRPAIRRRHASLNITPSLPSENSLWQPRPPASPPRLSPDSLEGRAAIQRIRNHLGLPDATPFQILSIRALPKELSKQEDLLQFEKDVLSVAWKQEDEDSAKVAKATRLH
jgi:hypothetical protein